jgi:hypothetical protein
MQSMAGSLMRSALHSSVLVPIESLRHELKDQSKIQLTIIRLVYNRNVEFLRIGLRLLHISCSNSRDNDLRMRYCWKDQSLRTTISSAHCPFCTTKY